MQPYHCLISFSPCTYHLELLTNILVPILTTENAPPSATSSLVCSLVQQIFLRQGHSNQSRYEL